MPNNFGNKVVTKKGRFFLMDDAALKSGSVIYSKNINNINESDFKGVTLDWNHNTKTIVGHINKVFKEDDTNSIYIKEFTLNALDNIPRGYRNKPLGFSVDIREVESDTRSDGVLVVDGGVIASVAVTPIPKNGIVYNSLLESKDEVGDFLVLTDSGLCVDSLSNIEEYDDEDESEHSNKKYHNKMDTKMKKETEKKESEELDESKEDTELKERKKKLAEKREKREKEEAESEDEAKESEDSKLEENEDSSISGFKKVIKRLINGNESKISSNNTSIIKENVKLHSKILSLSESLDEATEQLEKFADDREIHLHKQLVEKMMSVHRLGIRENIIDDEQADQLDSLITKVLTEKEEDKKSKKNNKVLDEEKEEKEEKEEEKEEGKKDSKEKKGDFKESDEVAKRRILLKNIHNK